MNEHTTLRRLRSYLFSLAAVLFAGTVVELLLAGHTDGAVQLIPFGLSALGLLSLTVAWRWPGQGSVLATRLLMLVVAGGSLLGVVEHFLANRGFALETRPDMGTVELFREALTGGVPLLAPGILAVAAAVTFAATLAGDGLGSHTALDAIEGKPIRTYPPAGDGTLQHVGSSRQARRPALATVSTQIRRRSLS